MDNYISREQAIATIKGYGKAAISAGRKSLDPVGDTVGIAYVINAMPAADVEPVRHGRWERCFEDWRQQIEGDKCSLCRFEYYGTGISRFLYCPNCGAKMDLEGENNG